MTVANAVIQASVGDRAVNALKKSVRVVVQGGRERRVGGPPRPGMLRYRIEVGHADGVRPGNIVRRDR